MGKVTITRAYAGPDGAARYDLRYPDGRERKGVREKAPAAGGGELSLRLQALAADTRRVQAEAAAAEHAARAAQAEAALPEAKKAAADFAVEAAQKLRAHAAEMSSASLDALVKIAAGTEAADKAAAADRAAMREAYDRTAEQIAARHDGLVSRLSGVASEVEALRAHVAGLDAAIRRPVETQITLPDGRTIKGRAERRA